MSQLESLPTPMTFSVTIADASNLPIYHVNALGLRASNDEFFFTLGVVTPPDQAEVVAATEAGHLVAQPIFRFAISRDTMEKFLAVMAGQYDHQTAVNRQLHRLNEERISENE